MATLQLKLLGYPSILRDGVALTDFHSNKVRALLFYLAVTRRTQARTTLAGLFWAEYPTARAMANLRKALSDLRKFVGDHLVIQRDRVRFAPESDHWLDVAAFSEGIDQLHAMGDPQAGERALAIYRGDFLEGFYLKEAPEWESWMLAQRLRLSQAHQDALFDLSMHYGASGHYSQALMHAQKLAALEPLREDVHRLLMILYARSGQRGRAQTQYETCREILQAELGVEPVEETRELLEKITAGALEEDPTSEWETPVSPTPESIPRHNLSAAVTPFIGRELELQRIREWLPLADSRLLTIAGLGGVGKTRLAQEAAWRARKDFSEGVWYVPLVSLTEISDLVPAMANAMGITFSGQDDPKRQILNYLRQKETLLLLDNAEQLISQELTDFLLEVLARAPGVKIIVTSRERLRMQAEFVVDLRGLGYPDDRPAIAGSHYPAGQLFLQRLSSHGRPLAGEPGVDATVHQICRLVDGLPLALELAASWIPSMTLAEILGAIESSPDLLETDLRDVPARHRSIQKVFDTSWQMLTEVDRRILRKLAYFNGGYSMEAIRRTTGAAPQQVQGLADKSLLRSAGRGRYEMHSLVRQYALAKLERQPAEVQAIARDHGDYYADFLAARRAMILGPEYLKASAEIRADISNVYQAWEWALANRRWEVVDRSLETLYVYLYNIQGLYAEAAQRFIPSAEQIAQTDDSDALRWMARLGSRGANQLLKLGELESAEEAAQNSLALLQQHDERTEIARAMSTMGVIRWWRHDRETALQLTREAVALARENSPIQDLCFCLNNLGYLLSQVGDDRGAKVILEESLALSGAAHLAHHHLTALTSLSVGYARSGDYETARDYLERIVAQTPKHTMLGRRAQALNNLGMILMLSGQFEQALPRLEEAAHLYQKLGLVHNAAGATIGSGKAMVELGQIERATRHCCHVLAVVQTLDLPRFTLEALSLVGRLCSARQERATAAAYLTFVATQPETLVDTKNDVHEELGSLREQMGPEAFASAGAAAQIWTLDGAVQRALDILSCKEENITRGI